MIEAFPDASNKGTARATVKKADFMLIAAVSS